MDLRRLCLLLVGVWGLMAAGCRPAAVTPRTLVEGEARRDLAPGEDPLTSAEVRPLAAYMEGGVRLLGARAAVGEAVEAVEAKPGDRVDVTLVFLVEQELAKPPMVFIHAAHPLSEVNQVTADHPLARAELQAGDVVVHRVGFTIPAGMVGGTLVVRVGLYEGNKRFAITSSSVPHEDNRLEVARLPLRGAASADVEMLVKKRAGSIAIDGRLDETAWQGATRSSPFVSWDGKTPVSRSTTARLLWDEQALYVAFEGTDPDPFTPYQRRDDPLYEAEAVEVFIDADGDADVYVELQAAPNDLHFDASFRGGRRRGMDVGFNASFTTKTVHDGDHFVSEWRIPVLELLDIPVGEPRVGARWRINLFRLERIRSDGRVVKSEASAWSTPLSGDFHNLGRFGLITFVD